MTFGLLAILLLAAAQDGAPADRVPWTTSRLTGSPEPPPPLRSELAFPKLKFTQPVALVPFPGGKRYVLVQEKGVLYTFRNDPACEKPDLFIDLTKEIKGWEKVERCRGVKQSFSIVFDPQFEKNRLCYVMYVLRSKEPKKPLENGSRVSRFKVTESDPPRIDPDSEEILLTWLAEGHNGCDLQFGNDGYLYISTGDGEDPSPPDRRQTGQDVSDLLSAILRIDVHKTSDGKPYAIPADNPFVGVANARPEIWCYGLRNPWRMNFDRKTGQLWIGDVGWERWEMVFAAQKGGNYGWSAMEGPQVCLPDAKRGPTPILPPAHAIPHPFAASITGGFVYHGTKLKGFEGWYIYGDWETRRVFANPVKGSTLGDRTEAARTPARIVGWAEEANGELLMVDYEGGGILRLVMNEAGSRNADFPRTLSRTGLFSALETQTPSPGVLPLSIRANAWTDGASAERWIAIPSRETIRLIDKNQEWPKESVWPTDSVVAKTLSMGKRKLETQVLHYDGQSWNAYSYVWNEAQTDAALAPPEGAEVELGGGRKWKVLARTSCLTCHNPWPGYALTINGLQLEAPKLKQLQDVAILPKKIPMPQPLVDPYDESLPLNERARSYLAVNCACCHRFGGGGAAKIILLHDVPLTETRLDVRPSLGMFDLTDPYLIAGGDPSRSALLFRVSKLGQGRMPHVGSEAVDEAGVRLLRRWIASLQEAPIEAAARDARAADKSALARGDVDRLLTSTTGALDLLAALETMAEPARKEAIRKALERPPGLVRDLFEAYEPPSQRRERLGLSIKPEKILSLNGDVERGRALFANPGLQCAKCHRVQPGKDTVGPDLSKIAAKYNRAQLLESILEPSKTVDPNFVAWIVQLKSGDVLNGIIAARTDTEIVLRDADKDTKVALSAIERRVQQQKSLMPEGLFQHLTAQEAADLLSFLESLR
ncbi:MAG TPA: PQQ-dependent sugar dehydrogenase [Planctomycetota bacterium]|nr:PQQ-dependent sugar dehydrogenase [Planctomycetota bacterium]